jgi:hypothetical protein
LRASESPPLEISREDITGSTAGQITIALIAWLGTRHFVWRDPQDIMSSMVQSRNRNPTSLWWLNQRLHLDEDILPGLYLLVVGCVNSTQSET